MKRKDCVGSEGRRAALLGGWGWWVDGVASLVWPLF